MRAITGVMATVVLLGSLTSVGCGGRVEGETPSGGGTAAPAAAAGLKVVGERAGSHELAATDAWFIRTGDAYIDFYLTNHAMTRRDAYDPSFALGADEVVVLVAAQNMDRTPLAAGQTFTYDSSSNSRVAASLRSGAGHETFTIVDNQSLGTLTITELSADRVRGTIEIVAGERTVRGEFVARPIGS